ncbi:branched-chain amino acid ABC transporter permease [Segnochrobactrum spirostomi]|uniref:Branched-chain amino acid ABC transporter permease n=1 Tax=Segnochrobactrum spirostomi TaxID=2608987 RepID=A0A6A7Y5X8_9HYPH|nr:branched-chain amino acid ABC transporter permease [Segnochrobactrum spirostomi]MQT14653.1 branched-chain amino acid ABC transporter permease [Segnochrobactrum spirostomi]
MSSIETGSPAVAAAPAFASGSPNARGLALALGGLAALVLFVGVPLVGDDYWLNAILIPFLVMTLASIGLNLLMGYAGQASLGTGAFMATGAYATYNLLLRLPDLPLPVSLVLGGLLSGLVGVVVGLPSLRIKGFYLLATTLAAQFLLTWIFNQYGWFSNYSSSSSISAPRLEIAGHDLSSPAGRYLLTLTSVVVIATIAAKLVRSETGRTWMAIRDMDTAAAVIGVPVARGKLSAFFVGGFVCGIAGALWAFAYLGTVDAGSFNLDRSFQVMFIIIIGGLGSLVGSVIGAAFIVLLPILIDRVAGGLLGGAIDAGQLENFQKVLFGALIIWFLIKEPRGLAELLARAVRWLRSPARS